VSARAGVRATAAMSTVMLARWAAQRDVPPPPQVVTENTLRKVGIEPASLLAPLRHLVWPTAHAAFGATLGVLSRRVVRVSGSEPQTLRGVGYGIACWTANYGIVLPLLGIYPRADRDARLRAADSFLSHVVFGWALSRPSRG
jgi:hypothetical protein